MEENIIGQAISLQERGKAVLFLFEFTSPRTYDPGFGFFVEQMFKTGGKKTFQVRFFLQKWA